MRTLRLGGAICAAPYFRGRRPWLFYRTAGRDRPAGAVRPCWSTPRTSLRDPRRTHPGRDLLILHLGRDCADVKMPVNQCIAIDVSPFLSQFAEAAARAKFGPG